MSDWFLYAVLGFLYVATVAWSYASGHADGEAKAAKQKGKLEVVWSKTGQSWNFEVAPDDNRRVILTLAEGTTWQPANHPYLPS